MKFRNKNFNINNGITDFSVKNPITLKVKEFYEEYPFPNYKVDDSKHTILSEGDKNEFSKELKNFIGFNRQLVEIGAGTCQLSNYLAIGTNNQICAFDSSLKSLEIGKDFAIKNNIQNINFVKGDIFDQIFEDEIFDFVLCNGVLHHTKNPYEAFVNIISCLKRGGYVLIGLYNKFGRIRTQVIGGVHKIFGENVTRHLDAVLRKIGRSSKEKIKAWIRDQYFHPVESTHTFDEVLKWFKLNNIEFINSIPKCSLFDNSETSLFEKNSYATFPERIFQQIFMIFNKFGSEGSLFIFIGKKK